ncbi:uncharacterized protein [Linepithema humile]|uniref:uncharacterized protein isoform X2 n=1 Tax=Linepithema humile TaxID=83485 RepID=UPI000623054A|nr:PREDICTED: uncharacterized protein LOC105670827 isoform X2 [Linepithema humile]
MRRKCRAKCYRAFVINPIFANKCCVTKEQPERITERRRRPGGCRRSNYKINVNSNSAVAHRVPTEIYARAHWDPCLTNEIVDRHRETQGVKGPPGRTESADNYRRVRRHKWTTDHNTRNAIRSAIIPQENCDSTYKRIIHLREIVTTV